MDKTQLNLKVDLTDEGYVARFYREGEEVFEMNRPFSRKLGLNDLSINLQTRVMKMLRNFAVNPKNIGVDDGSGE